MGHNHNEIINNVKKTLEKSEFANSSLYLFGSQAIHLEKDDSDYDLLLVSQYEIEPKRKNLIKRNFFEINYNVFIFSEKAASSERPIYFLDSTAIEGAARYGSKLYGKYKLIPSMTETDFAYCRYIQAFAALIEWNEWILSKKKTAFSDPTFITKEFALISLLVWYLEKEIPFPPLLSLGHFVQYHLENRCLNLRNDHLWIKMEKSGLLWSWLDQAFVGPLTEAELDDWAIKIGKRLRVHLGHLTKLKDQNFCHEFMVSQRDDRIFKGLEWDQLEGSQFRLRGGAFGLMTRLALGLSRRAL